MSERLELSAAHAQWLEEKRQIPSELAAELGIVSKGVNLVFEYRRNDVLLWRQVRYEKPDGKTFACFAPDGRTLKEAGIALSFWNEDNLLDPSTPEAPRIITEGQFDTASVREAGYSHVGSVPNGATDRPGEGEIRPDEDHQFQYLWELKDERWRLRGGLATARKIILATDGDKAGRVLRDELAVRLGRNRCWFLTYPPGCKDANEVRLKHGVEGVRALIESAKPMTPSQLVSYRDIPRSSGATYSVGWQQFDRHFMLCPPQLIVVTGRANEGKSQWTLAVVANLARIHKMKCAILQFEDNPDRNRDDLLRYAKTWARDSHDWGIGDPEDWVHRMFVTIAPSEARDEDEDFDLKWLEARIEEAILRHGCKIVLIDPWNEVEHMWGRQDTEALYLNRALSHINRLKRRYGLAIFIVAHPRNDVAKAKIDELSLYDINGGAAWRNKADLGVVIAGDRATFERDVKVDKSKDFHRMGIPGTVTMRFDPKTGSYTVVV